MFVKFHFSWLTFYVEVFYLILDIVNVGVSCLWKKDHQAAERIFF